MATFEEEPPPPYSELPPSITGQQYGAVTNGSAGDADNVARVVETDIKKLMSEASPLVNQVEELQKSALDDLNKAWKKARHDINNRRTEIISFMNDCFDQVMEESLMKYTEQVHSLNSTVSELNGYKSKIDQLKTKGDGILNKGSQPDLIALQKELRDLKVEIDKNDLSQYSKTKVFSWSWSSENVQASENEMKRIIGYMNFSEHLKTNSIDIVPEFAEERKEPVKETPPVIPPRVPTAPSSQLADIKYRLLHSFSTKTFRDRARSHPVSFVATTSGNLIVPDRFNKKVKVFTDKGLLLNEIHDSNLEAPSYVALNNKGHLAVSDQNLSTVHVFNEDMVRMGQYLGVGSPRDICFDKYDNLLVIDGAKKSVELYNSVNDPDSSRSICFYTRQIEDSRTRKRWDQNFRYFLSPQYVATNENNLIIVSDQGAHSIQIHDVSGAFLHKFGSKGSLQGCFKEPYGISTCMDGGLLVADYGNHRIQHLDLLNGFSYTVLSEADDIKFPTDVKQLADGRIVVSEYMSCKIKVFGTDRHLEEDTTMGLPSYTDIYSTGGASGGNAPSAPLYEETV